MTKLKFLSVLPALVLVAGPAALAASGSGVQGGASYARAVDCAAITQAAGKLAEGTKMEATHFDHYVHWSMAAADAGRATGKAARAVDGEIASKSGGFMAKLSANDAGTTAALASCAANVPDVNK